MKRKKEKNRIADKNKNMKYNVVESLNFPKDLILGSAIVSITGYQELFVENYRGILEYTECCIVLSTKTCQIRIEGMGLQIEYYTSEEMKICGEIHCLFYER